MKEEHKKIGIAGFIAFILGLSGGIAGTPDQIDDWWYCEHLDKSVQSIEMPEMKCESGWLSGKEIIQKYANYLENSKKRNKQEICDQYGCNPVV